MKQKIKTHKALSKRIRITRNGKLIARKGGQDRYNSKERSGTRMAKRKDIAIATVDKKNIKTLLPYN